MRQRKSLSPARRPALKSPCTGALGCRRSDMGEENCGFLYRLVSCRLRSQGDGVRGGTLIFSAMWWWHRNPDCNRFERWVVQESSFCRTGRAEVKSPLVQVMMGVDAADGSERIDGSRQHPSFRESVQKSFRRDQSVFEVFCSVGCLTGLPRPASHVFSSGEIGWVFILLTGNSF